MTDDMIDALVYALNKGAKMGCDIHLYSEIKKDGHWVAEKASTYQYIKEDDDDYGYHDLEQTGNSSRNYRLFGLLAGVRTEWPWSFPARGMPDDACDILKTMSDCEDWHSHSHLTIAELKHLAAELMISAGDNVRELSDMLASFIDSLGQADVPDTDRRIVFWFDN